MTLRYINGFEDITDLFIEGGAPSAAAGGRNGNSLHMGTSSDAVSYRLPTGIQSSTVTFGVALKVAALGASMSTSAIITLYDPGFSTEQLRICIGGSGQIAAYRLTTQLGISATGVIATGTYQYIEVQTLIDATVGTVTIRVNGTAVLTLTGQNTKGSGSSAIVGSIKFWANTTGSTTTADWDDLYLMTGTGDSFQGDCRVETLYPNGNGTTNAWTNSAGNSTNNYSYVDENPVDTSDYVASSTSGQDDLYTLTDLSSAASVLAVQPTIYAVKTDSTTRSVKIITKRSGSVTAQASQALDNLTAFVLYNCLTTDPDTSGVWTPTNVNALQAGVEAA